ncbi:MAG: cytochrome P450, partial [Myxococcota bacterium]
RIAQPAFDRKRIAQFAEAMVAATDEMVGRWEAAADRGDHVDVDAEMMALTLRIVGECLMSTDLTDDADRVSAALKTLLMAVLDRVSRPVLLPLDIPTPGNLALRRALSALDDMVLRIIQERRTGKTRRDDLLELLVHAVDADTGAAMDDQQLRDEVITMVLAGHETTSNGLTWAFHLLSKFPAVAQRCREEVAVVLGERSPTAADLPHLPYCRATVEESLRLFPPVWMVARSVRHDVQLGGYDIPPGWLVFISPWVMHRDPRFWKNPEGFRPERFLGDEIKGLPKASFIPFVAGPRQCIGAGFARMEAQLILIRILQKFELELVPHRRIELQPMVTLRPRFGMPMFPRRVTLPAAPHAAE